MPTFGDLKDTVDLIVFDFPDMRHIVKSGDVPDNCRPIAYWSGKGPVLYCGDMQNVLLAASQQMVNTIRSANVSLSQQWSIIEKQGHAIKNMSAMNERLRAMVDATQSYLQLIRDDYKEKGLEMPGLMSSEDVRGFKEVIDEISKEDEREEKEDVQKMD